MRAVRLAADGWRDVSWFDELVDRIATTGRGELWFVSGNRRGLLDQVRARARDAPNCIPAGPDAPDTGDEVRDGLVAAAGTFLALINPLAELVLQLGDVGMKLFRERTVATSPDRSDLFGFLDDLVRAAMAKGDTVVLVVDADNRDDDLWSRRFTQITARAGRLQHQRLAMIVGLPDAPPDAGDVDATFPKLVQDAASIVADSKARWHWVPPLTPELVMDVLPLTDETAQLLVTVAGGDDHLATRRWSLWVDEGAVRPGGGGVWALTDDPKDYVLVGIERAFDAVFDTDRRRVDRGQLALTCAALLGDEFCAETVLRAMVFAGEDYHAAEDDLDALLGDDNRRGLLQTVDHDLNRPGWEPEYLWRYRFDDPAVAVFFRGATHDDAERERLVRSLLTNLVELRLDGGMFDITIGRLAREVGEAETATVIEDRFATRQELVGLDADAMLLLSLVVTWDPTDLYLGQELYEVSWRLMNVGLMDRAVECGSAAVRLVREYPDPPTATLALALFNLGLAHRRRGGLDEAINHLTEARTHHQAVFDQQPTPTNRESLAVTLRELGGAQVHRGELDEAISCLTQAQTHHQAVFDQQPTLIHRLSLAVTLGELGVAHRQRGELDEAINHLTQARTHHQAVLDQQPTLIHRLSLAVTLGELGVAHRQRGELDEAINHLSQARTHHQALFDQQPTPARRESLAVTLHELGVAHRQRGELDEAINHLSQARTHHQALFDQRPTPTYHWNLAVTLRELGVAHRQRGELDEAINHLSQARTHHQAVVDQQPTPSQRLSLAANLRELGVAHRQRGELDEAINHLTQARTHLQALFGQQPTPAQREVLDATLDALRELGVTDV
jgi:tetratricopeptide (TPR) repeat protein